MNSWLVLPLVTFVQFYFSLITYHMMGYAIYQYHDELGVIADVSFEKAEAQISPNKAVDPFLTKLGALIAEGKEAEAISLLREELRTNWEKNDLHERYQRLLVASGKQELALSHARDFIGKLVAEKRLFLALDLCEQSLKADPEFQLHNSDHVHELATAARLAKRPKLALDLMRRFDKRYPGHKHIPLVYLLSAQILSEHYRMDKEAAQILRTLQSKFPDHALASEARQYMEVLTKFNAVG
jgi:tetratricopeptide (TPR) repeat protein